MIRLTRVLAVTALCAGMALIAPAAAGAADSGLMRLAHLSPDTPAGDVYVASVADPDVQLTFPGVSYGTVSDYTELPAGAYAISMRSAGAAPDSPPILSATVEVEPGSAHTVAGVGRFSELGMQVLDDDLTPPPPGQTRARVVSAAATATMLDASADGVPLATGLAFAQTGGYATAPGGAAQLQLTVDGATTEVPVDLAPGSVYSLFVLDRPEGGLTVRTVLDAAGSGVVPTGGVGTGAGGAAAGELEPAVVVGAVGLTALTGLLLSRRSRRSRRGPARHAARS